MKRFGAVMVRLFAQKSDRGAGRAAIVAMALLSLALLPAAARAADKEKEKEIPKPEDVELSTRDGVQIEATYYGSLLGKDAVPIVMLHSFKKSRAEFEGLALAMQARGHAVIVPDLVAVPWILRTSDLITAVAGRTARRLAALGGLEAHAAPLELPTWNVIMMWHNRDTADPANAWLRELLSDLADALG